MKRNEVKVLDHGFVRLLNIASAVPRQVGMTIDDLGCEMIFSARDNDTATSARISFNNADKVYSEEQDLALVEYLMSHFHNTPLEMTEIWLHMQMPIFVARQFVRHRTACINEVSARYAVLPEQWYIPEVIGGKSASNKQGQQDSLLPTVQEYFKLRLEVTCKDSYAHYLEAIRSGVAPEHARLFLHVNHYTHWVFKQDLHNIMHFLALRLESHAQVEAIAYAEAIYTLLKQQLPKTMEFFDIYRRMATKEELSLLLHILECHDPESAGAPSLTVEETAIVNKLIRKTSKQLK